MLVSHQVYCLETGVIIDDDECVTPPSVCRRQKGSTHVDVYESPWTRGVCFGTGFAGGHRRVAQALRSVRSEFREPFKAGTAAV
eukprot:6214043-Pleurochrysis_carterae.AAC.1